MEAVDNFVNTNIKSKGLKWNPCGTLEVAATDFEQTPFIQTFNLLSSVNQVRDHFNKDSFIRILFS